MKNIAIFGSTGSIGRNTLEVVRSLNKNGYPVRVKYITGNSNSQMLCEQIKEFKPSAVVVYDRKAYEELKGNLNTKCEIFYGEEGVKDILNRGDIELAVNALVGFCGLPVTLECVQSGIAIALANKESLVVAGKLITDLLSKNNSSIIPIDSEHSAIHQCLRGESLKDVSRIILTASGGPFRNYDYRLLSSVTVEQALNHPNWKMGSKITIDSATLMNKGLEVIETRWLFSIDPKNIEVIVHPQSIIHSLVEFSDGSYKAQLGIPDMKIPIQYALTYPDRIVSDFGKPDFTEIASLTFEKPDLKKFKCLEFAYEALNMGGTYPVVLNASNEVAVELFLQGKIKFTDIADLISSSLDSHISGDGTDIASIREADRWAREHVYESVSAIH